MFTSTRHRSTNTGGTGGCVFYKHPSTIESFFFHFFKALGPTLKVFFFLYYFVISFGDAHIHILKP